MRIQFLILLFVLFAFSNARRRNNAKSTTHASLVGLPSGARNQFCASKRNLRECDDEKGCHWKFRPIIHAASYKYQYSCAPINLWDIHD